MTGEDLAALVARLTATWPAGVRGHIWSAELCMLEASAARRTYDQLARSEDRPPSVARFLDVYRAVTAPLSGLPTAADTGPPTSLDEHLERLEWRVNTGDHTAVVELEAWRRLRAQSVERHPSTTTFAAAQPTLEPADE